MTDSPHDNSRSTPVPAGASPDTSLGRSRTALIVEDDPAYSEMLARHLHQSGYRPVQHYRGRGASEAARRLRPSLVTLDVNLPDVDGWSVLRELKSVPFMQRVPVLIISVLEEIEHAGDCGPTVFLRKPARRADLVQAISRLAPAPSLPTRVLMVDDDALMTEMVSAMLPPAQFTVQVTHSAQQAAASLEAGLPDLILLDLVMPRVNGFEFLQTLRADSRTRHIPVLVLTAKHLTIEEQNDLSQAAQIVIAKKTFTPEQLLEKLQYLERVRPLLTPAADFTPHADTPAASVDMAQFHDDFMAEAHTCLSNLDVALEQYAHSHDANAIECAARAAHTLKGAASVMSYPELSDAAARAEDLLNDQPALDLQRLALIRGLQRSMERMIARIQAPASV